MEHLHNPVFILGSHKSGTSLLKNLLDGHVELFAMPNETHFFQYSGHWVDYALRQNTHIKTTLEQQKSGLYQFLSNENVTKDPFGPGNMVGRYDADRFKESINKHTARSEKQLFSNYMHTLHYSLTGNILAKDKRIVEKSVENSEFAMQLKKWFPSAKFIHIIRNPYATITAIRKMKSGSGFPFLGPIIDSLHNSLYSMYKNKNVLSDYMVIRYEDLLQEPELIMRSIANHLEIEFSQSLMEPTLFGQPWHGNSTSNEKLNTISTTPINKWKKSITNIEITLVNQHLAPIISSFNYETTRSKPSIFLLPKKNESLKNYLRNRALLKTRDNNLF